MSGIDFIADTNILIYFLEENPAVKKYKDKFFAVSIITEIELLGKKNLSEQELSIIRNVLDDCKIHPVSNDIKDITIDIRRKYSIKIPDAIIAATSMYYDKPLLTADTDFSMIDDLKLVLIRL
ncbi:MAG: type II toxin-antitoxin system VapC family toxin [Bacteroidales bacterium]|jgi:predicted nucleic acid-binding protein|nr:type II toxin-antitoxin system VapC family toxin [Bacteroidales bacterium]